MEYLPREKWFAIDPKARWILAAHGIMPEPDAPPSAGQEIVAGPENLPTPEKNGDESAFDWQECLSVLPPEELKKPDWHPLSRDMASFVLPLLHQIPGLAANQAVMKKLHGAVRLVLPEGFDMESVTFQSAPKLGEGVHYPDIKDGKGIVARAGIKDVDKKGAKAAADLSKVFAALSAVTLQYYLESINQSMDSIRASVQNIEKFLEQDKLAELQADCAFLDELIDRMRRTGRPEPQAFPTVQAIRLRADANVRFYQTLAGDEVLNTNMKPPERILWIQMTDPAETYLADLDKPLFHIWAYWFSLLVYSRARVMELILSEHRDAQSAASAQSDILRLCDEYERLHEKWWEHLFHRVDGKFHVCYPGRLPDLLGNWFGSREPLTFAGDNPRTKEFLRQDRRMMEFSKADHARPLAERLDMLAKPVRDIAIDGETVYVKLDG